MPITRKTRVRNTPPHDDTLNITSKKPRGRPKSVVAKDKNRDSAQHRTRSSRTVGRRETSPFRPEDVPVASIAHADRNSNDELVAAIAGLKAHMNQRIDNFAEGMTARIQTLERSGVKRRSTRSLSSEARLRNASHDSAKRTHSRDRSSSRRRSASARERRRDARYDQDDSDDYDNTRRNREFFHHTASHGA